MPETEPLELVLNCKILFLIIRFFENKLGSDMMNTGTKINKIILGL